MMCLRVNQHGEIAMSFPRVACILGCVFLLVSVAMTATTRGQCSFDVSRLGKKGLESSREKMNARTEVGRGEKSLPSDPPRI